MCCKFLESVVLTLDELNFLSETFVLELRRTFLLLSDRLTRLDFERLFKESKFTVDLVSVSAVNKRDDLASQFSANRKF